MLETGAARRVLTADDVRDEVDHLFSHPATRDRMSQAGLSLVRQGRGALARTLAVLDSLEGAEGN